MYYVVGNTRKPTVFISLKSSDLRFCSSATNLLIIVWTFQCLNLSQRWCFSDPPWDLTGISCDWLWPSVTLTLRKWGRETPDSHPTRVAFCHLMLRNDMSIRPCADSSTWSLTQVNICQLVMHWRSIVEGPQPDRGAATLTLTHRHRLSGGITQLHTCKYTHNCSTKVLYRMI